MTVLTESRNTEMNPLTLQLGPRGTLVRQLVDGLDPGALQWLSGYLAGLAAAPVDAAPATAVEPALARGDPSPPPGGVPLSRAALHLVATEASARATIVYGTQTGNSRRVAEQLREQLRAAGLAVRCLRAGEYALRELPDEQLLYVVISTQGDGDPPDDARGFVDLLLGKRAPNLERVRYAVLGLGDSSYPKFNHVARLLDARLAQLGAQRLLARTDCDAEFARSAADWSAQAVAQAKTLLGAVASAPTSPPVTAAAAKAFDRANPFTAPVLANQRITARAASKDVRHLELSLEGSRLMYQPGDALGVWPTNPLPLVNELVMALGLDAAEEVTREGRTLPLARWLTSELEITRLSRPFLEAHTRRSRHADLRAALAPAGAAALRSFLKTYQLIDLQRRYPASWSAAALVGALRPLTPRLYSIASSQRRVDREVHLTVAIVDYERFGARHCGAASAYLAALKPDEGRAPVFVEPNTSFRLPADGARDIIMIGPGTGVAPFRAFLQDRAELGATGRSWLFFGEQHARTQFLYQTEWLAALKDKTLTRLEVAFSRDQAEKVYVQHRLRECGRDLYAWLEGGAHLYVCGDAERMAPDVDAVLHEVVATHGGKSPEAAGAYLQALRDQQRYQRDVY